MLVLRYGLWSYLSTVYQYSPYYPRYRHQQIRSSSPKTWIFLHPLPSSLYHRQNLFWDCSSMVGIFHTPRLWRSCTSLIFDLNLLTSLLPIEASITSPYIERKHQQTLERVNWRDIIYVILAPFYLIKSYQC